MTFALINNGSVAQVSAAQFPVHSAFQWVDLSGISPAPQAGWTYAGGVFAAPAAPTLTLAQQAGAAIGAGLTITLSGSLTLAATLFPTDPVTQTKLLSVMTIVNSTGTFPGGVTTYKMRDSALVFHVFTVSQYKQVAAAIGTYVAALVMILDGNPDGAVALPAASVSLTV